jgi:hypothetical protein
LVRGREAPGLASEADPGEGYRHPVPLQLRFQIECCHRRRVTIEMPGDGDALLVDRDRIDDEAGSGRELDARSCRWPDQGRPSNRACRTSLMRMPDV